MRTGPYTWSVAASAMTRRVAAILLLISTLATDAASEPAPRLNISPSRPSLLAGETVRFRAESPEGGPAAAKWQVIPPWLGTITPDGSFTAGSRVGRGIARAIVSHDGVETIGHTTIRVVGGAQSLDIRIIPGKAGTRVGEEIRFAIHAIDPSTRSEVHGDVHWKVVPATAGVISADGIFQPLAAGDALVTAAVVAPSGARGVGHAPVRIEGDLARQPHLKIVPPTVDLAAGATVQFELIEENLPDSAPVIWTVAPKGAGFITDGLFTAGLFPMEGRIFATASSDAGSARASARVRIGRADLAHGLNVRPEVVTVRPGVSVRFRLVGLADGLPVTWEVLPRDAGTITPDGEFTASRVLTDVATEGATRREAVIIAVSRGGGTGGTVLTGRARAIIGGGTLPATLIIEPPEIHAQISVLDPEFPEVTFSAIARGPNSSAPVSVDWSVRPENMFRTVPAVGRSTSLRLQPGIAQVIESPSLIGHVVGELTLENGQRIGARAVLKLDLVDSRLIPRVRPATIRTVPGGPVPLDLTVATERGVVVGFDRLDIGGVVTPRGLGRVEVTPAGAVFVAGEGTGEGVLSVNVSLKSARRVSGSVKVPVKVTAKTKRETSESARLP